MKIKKMIEVDCVLKFDTSRNSLSYQISSGEIFYDGIPLGKFAFNVELNYFNRRIYVNDWEGNFSVFSVNGTLLDSGSGRAYYRINDEYLGMQFLINSKLFESVLDTNNKMVLKIEFEKANNLNSISESYYLLLKNKSLVCAFSRANQILAWQVELSDATKLKALLTTTKHNEARQFIGIYNNVFWMLLNNGRYIGLDVITGEAKCFIKNIRQENIHGTIELSAKDKEGNRSPDDRNFYHLDQQKGKIIGESAKGIWEIDLTKPEPYLEVWGMEDQYNQYGLLDVGYKTVLQGDELFFIDFNALKWGIIDVTSKKLKWVSEKITDAATQLKEIQCGGDKVYILDGTKTLHVFERQAVF
jgi:hypothetical protein